MSLDRDVELEDRLRARLRKLNGIDVTSYAVLRNRSRRSSLPLLLAATVVGVAIVIGAQVVEGLRDSVPGAAPNASRCGQLPTLQPTLSAPTPAVASPNASTGVTTETTVGILVWSDCVRPQTATAHAGQLVQWAAAEEGIAPEIVLEDGTSLGKVQHVLEFRFSRSGTYRYHLREFPSVLGTIVIDDNVTAATAIQAVQQSPLASMFTSFPNTSASKPCDIRGGGPAPGLLIPGMCRTDVQASGSNYVATFSITWDARLFHLAGEPSSGQLQHSWPFVIDAAGVVTPNQDSGNFPPQYAR